MEKYDKALTGKLGGCKNHQNQGTPKAPLKNVAKLVGVAAGIAVVSKFIAGSN